MATEALMVTVMIDAHERRDVGIANIASAYLKAKMDDFVLLNFTGESVNISSMNPMYKKFVFIKRGNIKVLFVRLGKAMYGCVESALLWYNLFSSTLEGYKDKLKRVLDCINGTANMKYTLGADSRFRSWVDASYAVHPDMRIHTGEFVSFGTGGLICKSSNQKLNTKNSTEAKVVGASDYLPNALWEQMFMEAQGYPIGEIF